MPDAAGQGLIESSKAQLGASATARAASLLTAYRAAAAQLAAGTAWKAALRAAPAAACGAGSLCAPGAPHGPDDYAVLAVAASPLAHSSLEPRADGTLVISPPREPQEPCSACAAFAVVAAAEAALASAAAVNASDIMMSPADLYFCSPARPRPCRAGWTLDGALDELQARPLLADRCMPYAPAAAAAAAAAATPAALAACGAARRCNEAPAGVADGRFVYAPLQEHWEVQQHIRRHGAVVTRFDVYPDFIKFFADPGNARAVYKRRAAPAGAVGAAPPPAAAAVPHAVALVGYDLTRGYYLARNSWGAAWADRGSFRVALGEGGVLSPGETFGLAWEPAVPAPRALGGGAAPAPGRPGCYLYEARRGDCVADVAWRAGVDLMAFVVDNDLDAPLAGKTLLVCSGAAPPDPFALQRSALDSIIESAASKPPPPARNDSGAAPPDFCGWEGVACDAAGFVTSLALTHPAAPAPPGALLLLRLPRLASLSVDGGGGRMSARLPADWGVLRGLRHISVKSVAVLGSIPAEWATLRNLQTLEVEDCGLAGTLPLDLIAALAPSLESLSLAGNALEGEPCRAAVDCP
ncbi:MAG: hypothetical protein J3K34DRAFT_524140 [Monoraphidium minutum]|nr:MAG: hypothetical protein J3K34DRAFT_524140 [Monoraphidium minutum]